MNLHKYFNLLKGIQKIEKVIYITIKLLNIFKYVHCAKRTYNDLKLTNIMVNTQSNLDADPDVFLIDFGFSDKFLTQDGAQHIDEESKVEFFQGNILFASERQMNFKKTSRKDDLVSLFYLLIFMLNNQRLWIGCKDPS